MKQIPHCLITGLLALVPASALLAQSSPLHIDSFEVQRASLPGSQKVWEKLVCNFTNAVGWADGISFNYTVLVEPDGHPEAARILSGGVTYNSVPKGKNEAIMYLSPSGVLRFGEPVAVSIELDRGDRVVQTFQWAGKSTPPTDWQTKFPILNGTLLNIRATPWMSIDSEATPDLSTN